MKRNITLIYFLFVSFACIAQSVFDKALSDISTDITGKLKVLNKKKVVVLYITDLDKQMSTAGKYMADIISVNLVNNPGTFSVFDRDNLNEITEAKKLYAEGYIDEDKAKRLGQILNVDVIIVGSYTLLSNTIKLTLKALDSENGFVIAAAMKDLPLNADAGALLGISIVSNDDPNKSPNYTAASGEVTGRTSKNPDCKEKKVGDYCFQNSTQLKLNVLVCNDWNTSTPIYRGGFTVESGQKQCLYNLPTGAYTYQITEVSTNNNSGSGNSEYRKPYNASGSIYVEICQEKDFVIK